jgi:hypothetical protein
MQAVAGPDLHVGGGQLIAKPHAGIRRRLAAVIEKVWPPRTGPVLPENHVRA